MSFSKYHGAGNDYLVVDGALAEMLTPARIQTICDRHRGAGSDGILLGPLPSAQADFRLQIFNPDGSEAEKSGNGLRIFSRYLWDKGLVGNAPFTLETAGGLVRSQVAADGRSVTVQMGRITFLDEHVLQEVVLAGRPFMIAAVSIGNPHCVAVLDTVDAELAHTYGPLLERHPLFPKRTNVQFLQVLDRNNIRIEIWERGAGYTLSSGSSSCAAAAVAVKLGLCDTAVTSHMPGGEIEIELDADFAATMWGPVTAVYEGVMAEETINN
ncbi:MAG: diaminopimelate epimerase [Ardenticatenaceae bacterium]|nr:diaminopimelate epimerase [Ardenticatenaceae bacterium]MCB9003638.1 diaminopimelate epimerase [Ardenticatenaceae bacterium]